MSGGATDSGPARLKRRFAELNADGHLGGADPLAELASLAFACVLGTDSQKRAVAFGLGAFFQLHAADRSERPVSAEEHQQFLRESSDPMSNAVSFLNSGGTAEQAVKIVSDLAAASQRLLRSL